MDLSDRMKMYEAITASQMLIPNLPVMVRIDGKAFHTWTRGLERPYSESLQNLFDDVTGYLVSATNAVIGYTQSDEERHFTAAEIAKLPPQHEAHKNPDLMIQRHVIERLDLPPLAKVTNRYQIVFEGAKPEAVAA